MCPHPVLQVIPAARMVSIAREEGADSGELRREGPGSASSTGVLERGSEEATWRWLLKTSRMRGVRPLIRWNSSMFAGSQGPSPNQGPRLRKVVWCEWKRKCMCWRGGIFGQRNGQMPADAMGFYSLP